MDLFRVFPWVEGARTGTPGSATYVSTVQGSGRIDNAAHYSVLYASDSPGGAVAEVFGRRPTWTADMFAGHPTLVGSRMAIAHFRIVGQRILDLDDAPTLVDRGLQPSHVLTRERERTQAWALGAFIEGRWTGIRWWSYYEAAWGTCGIWGRKGIRVAAVEPLSLDHPATIAAAETLARGVAIDGSG